MSAGGAFGGARGYQPKAPDKGVFPLDHFGECKQVSLSMFTPGLREPPFHSSITNFLQVKEAYMECLKLHSQQADSCKELAKQYLQCRMDRCAAPAHSRGFSRKHFLHALNFVEFRGFYHM